MKIQFKWESIGVSAHRAKVIGGWVVADDHGMCFVPNPTHKWEIDRD